MGGKVHVRRYKRIKMHFVGQFLMLGVLLSVFLDIKGLQCWDNNKGQNDVSELKECSASKSTSCFIVEKKPSKSISQTYSEKSGGWTDNRHQISCYCTTDGCNETLENCSGMKIIASFSVIIAIAFFYIFL